jgi:uncharacterized protein YgiM (DUF1202 family)
MYTRPWPLTLLASALLWACATPAVPSPSTGPIGSSAPPTALPTAGIIQPTATLVPLPTLAPSPAPGLCTPQVTANTVINVRNGPGTIYSVIGSLNAGQPATVDAKNVEGTWWYILYPAASDGHGWVAGSVTTSSCVSASLPVIPASSLPAPFVAAITNVVVSVDPAEVNVPGCVGETQRMTAAATIHASGPMQVQYYFEIDGVGTTKTRTLTFTEYGSRDVSELFRPEVAEGKHSVRLWIEGLDVTGWQDSARYTITCH